MFSQDMLISDIPDESQTLDSQTLQINKLLVERSQNTRRSIALALKLGKSLCSLRDTFKRGEWGEFVLSNTGYRTIFEAQADMRLWETWRYKIGEYYGGISDGNIDDMVDDMNDESVDVSLSALMQFTKTDTPEYALDMALKVIATPEKYGKLTAQKSKKLVECAKVIGDLNEEQAEFARMMMEKWGVDNAVVLRYTPGLCANAELNESITLSGTVYVPTDGEGRETRIDTAGATDIELALGIARAEKVLQRYSNYRNKMDFLQQIESNTKQGLAEQFFSFLEYMQPESPGDNTQYTMRIYIKHNGQPDDTLTPE